MAGQILLVVGDAAEVIDTMYPYFRLMEEGWRVVPAGPERKLYHMVLHEKPPGSTWDITEERPGYHIRAEAAFRETRSADYDGMVITGGRAPEYLRYDADLLRLTREFFAAGKPVASVCHGIEIVAAADVIRGLRTTTVAKCRLDAEFAGAIYVDEEVVVSGCLVTCRTWHDSAPWMREYVKLLKAYVGRK